MRVAVLLVVIVTAATTTAAADPATTAGVEASVGGIAHFGALAMIGVDADSQIGATDWRWRAALAAGLTVADQEGHAVEGRLGIVHRARDCGRGCLYAGLDVAAVDATVNGDDPTALRGGFLVARGGLDVGGALRFRAGVELRGGLADVAGGGTSAVQALAGFALGFGFACAF